VQTDFGADSGSRALRAQAYNDGVAIEAESVDNAAATFHSSGVVPVGTVVVTCDEGTGVHVTSDNGVALTAVSAGTGGNGNYPLRLEGDSSSPLRGLISMASQNARPTIANFGDIALVSTASDQSGLVIGQSDNTFRSAWHSAKGYACAFVNSYGYGSLGLTLTNSVFTNVGTVTTAAVGDYIKVANATILLRLSFSMKSNSTTDTVISIRVRDVTDGNAIVWERSGTGSSDGAGYFVPGNEPATNRYWVPGPAIEIELTPHAVGTRQYTVWMCAPTNVALRIRDLTAAFVGTVA